MQLSRRPLPVWVLVVADVLAFAVALNVFALFHHVLPWKEVSVGIRSERGAVSSTADASAGGADPYAQEAQALPDASAEPAPEAAQAPAEPDPEGHFASKFADKFSAGAVEQTDSSYRSANINLTITPYDENGVRFFVEEFYLSDISSFQTGFAHDNFGRGNYESIPITLGRMNAIAGINGDYYGGRSDGIVLRNGTLYRDGGKKKLKRDLCVLYWDGRLETYSPEGFDVQAEVENGAYQIWNFGPMLLDEGGHAMTEFNSDVVRRNPRTALGYFEPGHYCFVVVDGRSDVSKGLTLQNLSKLMEILGCVRAYNMDGGKTSEMFYNGELVNVPADGGRMSTDVIGIAEP